VWEKLELARLSVSGWALFSAPAFGWARQLEFAALDILQQRQPIWFFGLISTVPSSVCHCASAALKPDIFIGSQNFKRFLKRFVD